MDTPARQPTLVTRRNARGFAYHAPNLLHVVEYRAHGGWLRVTAFWIREQADICCASLAARGYQARVRAEDNGTA